jgi:hypothetical protein
MSVRLKTLETITGEGEAFEHPGGARVGQVRYRITRTQEMHRSVASGSAPTETEGLIVARGVIEGDAVFGLAGEELVLHLADGRRFNCVVTNSNGRIGQVIGQVSATDPGDVYRP